MKYLIFKVDRTLCRTVEGAAIALLVAVASLSFYQVVTRFVLEQPSAWTEVLTRTCMVWCIYLGAMLLFRSGTHLFVDFAFRKSGPRGRRILNLIYCATALVVLGTAFVYGLQLAWRVRGQSLAGLDVSIAFAYLAVPVGALLSIVGICASGLRRGEAALIE